MPTPLLHEGSCQPPSPPRLRQMRCTVGSLPWLSLASHVIVLSGPLPSPRETPLRPQAPEPVSSVPLPNPAKLQGLSPHPTPCSLSAVIRGGSLVTRDLGCCVCVRARRNVHGCAGGERRTVPRADLTKTTTLYSISEKTRTVTTFRFG